MKTKIKIHFLVAVVLVTTIFKTWAQDGGYLPDLPGFPSGTYARVAAVGAKIHGNLNVTESDPVTGHVKRRHQMVYLPPTSVYWTRIGTTYEYTDPAIVARYSNPSLKDGRDVVSQRTTVNITNAMGAPWATPWWRLLAGLWIGGSSLNPTLSMSGCRHLAL